MATYRLIRRLATGGMAEVFLAMEQGAQGVERPVALKRLLPALAQERELVALFLREAELTLALRHEHLVQTLALGEHAGLPFMVLELVDGENLRTLQEAAHARGVALGLGEACLVVQQVAEGLAHAHACTDGEGAPLHLVHRDVNPANVLLSAAGEVKLTDFGIAKVANAQGSTQLGRVKGKSGYVSPEQILRGELDQRSDVFLLGLLLHELLAGRPLFAAPDYFVALRAIAHFDVQALPPLPGVPEALWQLVTRALAPDPAARFQRAQELADALRAFLAVHAPGVGRRELAALFGRVFPARRSPLALGEDPGVEQPSGVDPPLGAGLRAAAGGGGAASAPPPLHLLDTALAMLGGAAGQGP
ncbi:MAG TPA: serine/threonine-protein kinase, partial [Aggregicoccus sp.]|nr:serine/threonine-protein kinase [Aggregicoccus sp.]